MASTHQTSVLQRQKVASSHEEANPERPASERKSNIFREPSSSTRGFFQTPPHVLNQLHDDIALQRCLRLFLPSQLRDKITPELSSFADKVLSKSVLDWVADAEKNPPYLKTWDSWGRRRDDLVTSEGWRNLQALGIEEGMVAIGYENENAEYSRIHHFAKYHLWCGSSAWVNCPSLMVDGVAALFRKHLSDSSLAPLQRKVLGSAYDRLISRDPRTAWTTGQWMTERQGGSDVSQTETLASLLADPDARAQATDGMPLGPWLVNGFKWFSSATDANMMVFLARTSKGISTFFAPMRKTLPQGKVDIMGYETELNGVYIQRLKSKLGTRALPTAELELKGVRAHLIGEEGRGTKEIATVLNIARIHNGATAMGFWGRGLGISRAFARVRKVGLKPLYEKTSFVRTMARMHADYRANMLFTFFVSGLLGCVEQEQIAALQGANLTSSTNSTGRLPGVESRLMAEHLLRLLTPALKGITAKKAIAGLSECMESMGGVGYLENEDMQFNIARLYRDANVLSIWEGTTDMMAHDVLRVLYGKTSGEVIIAMDRWIHGTLKSCTNGFDDAAIVIIRGWWTGIKHLLSRADKAEMEMKSRAIMERLGDIVMGVLLLCDAASDDDQIAGDVFEFWMNEKKYRDELGAGDGQRHLWEEEAARNLRIVFATEHPGEPKAKL